MAATRGLVARRGGAGVQPHDAVGSAAEPGHGRGQGLGRIGVPAVAGDDDDGAAGGVAVAGARAGRARLVAMRVPPKRSTTAAVASSMATSASRWARTGVSRVSEVAKANTSASVRRAAARMRWR